MVYTYTPTYYSSFQDTLTSLCKSILPFSLKSRRQLPDQKLAKRQSDNLKWQQESFHRILQLIALCKEGMVSDADVSAFRTNMLDTLIASPAEQEPAGMIRDKLLFLQDLLYAKCISEREYHSSKRPLLQRLAVQGAELDCRDVIVGDSSTSVINSEEEEEWSVIDLRDKEPATTADKSKRKTPIKAFISSAAPWRGKGNKDDSSKTAKEPFGSVDLNAKISNNNSSLLMPEGSPAATLKSSEKAKRKPFRSLFGKEEKDGNENKEPHANISEEKPSNSVKKHWGFEGLKKWKKSDSSKDEATTPYLPIGERSDDASSIYCKLVASPIGEGPDTKKIKKKWLSDGTSSDFFVDKVVGDNIKKELSRIQAELSIKNQSLNFSDEQIEAISTKLPLDKADLSNFFPKSWCDRHGEVVLDVVKKEFKDHVGEMETLRNTARDNKHGGSHKWVSFEENEENVHPSIFCQEKALLGNKVQPSYRSANVSSSFAYNPFYSPNC